MKTHSNMQRGILTLGVFVLVAFARFAPEQSLTGMLSVVSSIAHAQDGGEGGEGGIGDGSCGIGGTGGCGPGAAGDPGGDTFTTPVPPTVCTGGWFNDCPPPAPTPVVTCTTTYAPGSSMTGACTNTWTNTTVSCSDGTQTITQSAVNTTCPPPPPATVTPPPTNVSCTYSGYVPWGAGCGAYYTGTVPDGGSTSFTNAMTGYIGWTSYSCSNGTWVPGAWSCTPFVDTPVTTTTQTTPVSCTTPWGATIADGVSVVAFLNPSVTAPSSCAANDPSQVRTCSNGTLSGSYTNANCVVLTPAVTITATPTRVQTGGSSTIAWSATGVKSCTVSGPGLSATGLTGSRTITVTAQSTYTLSCLTSSGSAVTASAVVNIVPTFRQF